MHMELASDHNVKCVFPPQQVKSGAHQSRLTRCDLSSAALPFSGASLPPVLDLSSQHAEGNANRVSFLATNNSINKSETPEPLSDKPDCASSPAVEAAKTQDYPSPRPIPEGKRGSLPVRKCQMCWTKDIHRPDRLSVSSTTSLCLLKP